MSFEEPQMYSNEYKSKEMHVTISKLEVRVGSKCDHSHFTIEKASSSTNNGAGRMYGKRFLHTAWSVFYFFQKYYHMNLPLAPGTLKYYSEQLEEDLKFEISRTSSQVSRPQTAQVRQTAYDNILQRQVEYARPRSAASR